MQKKLTISMLISGREHTTEKSLQSLQKLKQAFDTEIILVDTGCEELFLEKLRPYADTILSFAWCNDFAKARNIGLQAAHGEWFLYLDDDEWFEDVTPILTFLQSEESQSYHQGAYLVRNYTNMEGTKYSEVWVSRLIRLEEDTHFEGCVHESLVPVKGKCKKIPAFVHHYGYVYQNEEEKNARIERNISILEPLIEEEPNNLRWRLQIIQEYIAGKYWKKLRENAELGIELAENTTTPFYHLCRGSFYAAILLADIGEKETERLWEHATIFLSDNRNPWNVRCTLAAITAFGLVELNGNALRLLANWRKEKEELPFPGDQAFYKKDWESENAENYVEFPGDQAFCEKELEAERFINHVELQKMEVFRHLEKLLHVIKTYFISLEQYQAEEKDEQWQLINESAVLVSEYTTYAMQQKMCYLWANYLSELLLFFMPYEIGSQEYKS